MKVAIFKKGDQVYQHFGQSEWIVIYELDENKKVISSKEIGNGGITGCEMANLLTTYQVDTVIVGGIGENAKKHLEEENINLIFGVHGKVTDVINNFSHDTLQLNDVTSNRHSEGNHHYGKGLSHRYH